MPAACSFADRAFAPSPATLRRIRSLAATRPVHMVRLIDGDLHPGDVYALGISQGLQRAILSFASRQGICLTLTIDGVLDQRTVNALIAILGQIGLPPEVRFFPETDEEIAGQLRSFADWIYSSLRLRPDYEPREVVEPPPCRDDAVETFAEAFGPKPPSKTGRNIVIGAGVIAALGVFTGG